MPVVQQAGAPALLAHELFESRAALHPSKIAIATPDAALSYGELNVSADLLATALRRLGVGPEKIVVIFVPRKPAFAVAALAILKAGGAYAALDRSYPREHFVRVLDDTRATVIITTADYKELIPSTNATIIDIDSYSCVEGEGSSEVSVEPLLEHSQLAYVMYTSGTTRFPKGVMVEHSSVISLALWANKRFSAEQLDGVLAASSFAFDVSVFEILITLFNGGSVVLLPNALELGTYRGSVAVRTICATTSVLSQLVKARAIPESVTTVLQAGERLTRRVCDEIYETTGCEELINLCGATEDTVYSVSYVVPRSETEEPPIGMPILGRRAYILNDAHQIVEDGVEGDLYYAGTGVSRGYLNLPEATSASFLPEYGVNDQARMYRSGDRAIRLSDGALRFVGRIDDEVKIRGCRVKFGAVEAAFRGYGSVSDIVVIPVIADGSETRLNAYVVPNAGFQLSDETLRSWADDHLVSFARPATYTIVDALPLAPTGKVDRKALAVPALPVPNCKDAFIDEIEASVAAIFCSVLNVERVGRFDNFFLIGGTSLGAARVVVEMQRNFRIADSSSQMSDAFRLQPTVSGMAASVRQDLTKHEQCLEGRPWVRLISAGAQDVVPLIFFDGDYHGSGSYCWRLAMALGNIPFLAVTPHGRGGLQVPATIEQAADDVIFAIRQYRPHGPYRLGGFCAGGIVALEVAKRLQDAGEEILDVAVIGASAGVVRYRWILQALDGLGSRSRNKSQLLHRATSLACALVDIGVAFAVRYSYSSASAVGWLIKRLTAKRRATGDNVERAWVQAVRQYRPRGTFPVTVLWSVDELDDFASSVAKHWRKLFPSAKVAFVRGHHFDLEQRVEEIAHAMRQFQNA